MQGYDHGYDPQVAQVFLECFCSLAYTVYTGYDTRGRSSRATAVAVSVPRYRIASIAYSSTTSIYMQQILAAYCPLVSLAPLTLVVRAEPATTWPHYCLPRLGLAQEAATSMPQRSQKGVAASRRARMTWRSTLCPSQSSVRLACATFPNSAAGRVQTSS